MFPPDAKIPLNSAIFTKRARKIHSLLLNQSKHKFLGKLTAVCSDSVVKPGIVSLYDCIFKRPMGYDEKLHRCDREHAKSRGLHINDEEKARPMAVLSSSEYGRRIDKPVEKLVRDHVRIKHVQTEFYRKNEITCLKEKSSRNIEST